MEQQPYSAYGDDEAVQVLDAEECWEALDREEFGRLAYLLGDEVQLAPVNYALDGRTLLFRTAEGSKLLGVVMNPDVVFEIDAFTEDEAMSVICRGRARLLEEDEAHRAENVPLRPWVDTLKYNVVEITVDSLSGRRFKLSRPWLHLRPEE